MSNNIISQIKRNMLKRVTVDSIREKYWDPVTKTGKPVTMYTIQDYDEQPDSHKEEITFVPDGSLIHKRGDEKKKYDDWLSTELSGPYHESDLGKSLKDYYYLGGYTITPKGKYEYNLQICTKPVNILSDDCLDAVDAWTPRS